MITAFIALVKSLSWQTYLCVALGVAGAAIYADKTVRIDVLVHELAGMTKQRDDLQKEIDEARQLATAAEAEQQTKARQIAADEKENANEAQRFSIRARDDSSAASTALAQLLQRATAARSSQSASNPEAAGLSTTAQGPGLRTDLLGSVGAEAVRYANKADIARGRGFECEGDYDTVAKPIESEKGDDAP